MKRERPYITASSIESGKMLEFAHYNRKNPTEAESIMWNILRRRFHNFKFRRQHIIGTYIADFICLAKQLVIEIDGGYHNSKEQQAADKERTAQLQTLGLTVMRFTNEEVVNDIEMVTTKIKKYLINELI